MNIYPPNETKIHPISRIKNYLLSRIILYSPNQIKFNLSFLWECVMQIREQGRKIQFIRSEYQPELKRSSSKVVATCSRYASALLAEELHTLTAQEQAQVAAFFEKKRQDSADWRRSYSVQSLQEALEQTTAHLQAGQDLDTAYAASLWQAMAKLQKMLKKSGYAKPTSNTASKPIHDLDRPA